MTYYDLARTMGAKVTINDEEVVTMSRGAVIVMRVNPSSVYALDEFTMLKNEKGHPTFVPNEFLEETAKLWVEKVFNEFFR